MIFTKEKKWLDKWDKFVWNNYKGSHLVFSDWLQSYECYGFDVEIGLYIDNGKILGGFGAIIAKMSFFKFYIVPHGPIMIDGYEDGFEALINNLYSRAKKIKCCYVQYSMPFSNNSIIELYSYNTELKYKIKNLGEEGSLFKYVYSSYGINWLDFNIAKSPEELLQQFATQPRRNVNLAYRNSFQIAYPQTEEDCRKAYSLIERNAKDGNYSIRKFEDFKKTILSLLTKRKLFLMTVSYENELKGAALFVDNGNYLTYISGGTKKEQPDLNIGYILHWEAIKKSYNKGYKGYNISMGGSIGVQKFKAKFMAKPIFFDNPHYHFVISPIVFKLFLFINGYFKRNKVRISNILKRIK